MPVESLPNVLATHANERRGSGPAAGLLDLLTPVPQFPIVEVTEDGIDGLPVFVFLNQPRGILLRELPLQAWQWSLSTSRTLSLPPTLR